MKMNIVMLLCGTVEKLGKPEDQENNELWVENDVSEECHRKGGKGNEKAPCKCC